MGSTLTNKQKIEQARAEGNLVYEAVVAREARRWQKYLDYVTRKVCRAMRKGRKRVFVFSYEGPTVDKYGSRFRLSRDLDLTVYSGCDRPWYLRWAGIDDVHEISLR